MLDPLIITFLDLWFHDINLKGHALRIMVDVKEDDGSRAQTGAFKIDESRFKILDCIANIWFCF